jgi:hypothetical protein
MQYTIFYLSSNLIEIISPTTIGLIDRTGIEWMDEFLSRHLLYMQI